MLDSEEFWWWCVTLRIGRELHQNSRGAPTESCHLVTEGLGCESCRLVLEGLGCEIIHITPCLQASNHDTKGLTLASLVFSRKLWLPFDMLFGAFHNKNQSAIDHAINFVGHLYNIRNYAHQHLKLASDWMKTHYDWLANCTGHHKGNCVWL
jgi:hypothetical protein